MKLSTRLFVLGFIALAIVYDCIAYKVGGVGATISRITLGWARDIPVVCVGIGVLIGHLFWPQKPEKGE